MIEGSFTIYYSVIWRAWIDERCTCPHYEDILHFQVLGGLSFISVSSSPFFIIKGSFTMYSSVVWRIQRDKRLAHLHCGDISHSLFWWAGTLGQSNFYRFLWSKAHLQSTIVSLKGLNRQEGHVSALRRYFTFSGFGGLNCISVSSPPSFIIKNSFTMYSSVIWRTKRDQRFVCLHSRDNLHFLFWWGWHCLRQFFSYFLWS